MKKLRAIGLVRISTAEQSPDSQIDSLRKIAEEMGYVISDNDMLAEQITGYDEDDLHDRDTIVQLKNLIIVNPPSAIFVWEMSRLSRRAIKVGRYIDMLSVIPRIPMYFCDYQLWTLDINKGNTPIDENIQQLQGGAKAVEIERERIKERTKRGRDAKAAKGLFVGHVKDGYTTELVNGEKRIIIDTDRAEVIRKIFNYYVNDGYSCLQIRDILNANDIPTTNKYRYLSGFRTGGYKETYKDKNNEIRFREETLWTDGLVSNILRDEWYIGIRRYHKDKRVKGEKYDKFIGDIHHIEPIIDEEIWDKAQAKLKTHRVESEHSTYPYLLTTLLYCGRCGRKMYGHTDGYSNMYYCSSKEYGDKCGLRWIRQESVDSIVLDIVRRRALNDLMRGETDSYRSFFSSDNNRIKSLKQRKSALLKLKAKAEGDKTVLQERIQQAAERILRTANSYTREAYENQIRQYEDEIERKDKDIAKYVVDISKCSYQVRELHKIEQQLHKINNLTTIEEKKELLRVVIHRIYVFNTDKQSAVLRIEYSNGKTDEAIYCPGRIKRNYILLQEKVGYHYDEEKNNLVANTNLILAPNIIAEDTEESYVKYKERFCGDKQATKEEVYACALGIDDFVLTGNEMAVIDYVNLHRSILAPRLFPFNDLQPLSAKGILRREYNRQYQKKYNTGRPTFTPYVIKDDSYALINQKRKRLYNRKYKILHNKNLTEEQRDALLHEISLKLDAFKYQVKYLETNLKGKRNKEKYNKSNTTTLH